MSTRKCKDRIRIGKSYDIYFTTIELKFHIIFEYFIVKEQKNSNNFGLYSKSKVIYNRKQFSSIKTNMTKRKQMDISRIYKENWYCNSILGNRANENRNTSMYSTGKFNRSTLKRRNCGELQEDLNVPSKRILRSTHMGHMVLNNCERNTSVSLLRIHKSKNKLSETKTSNMNVNNKAILKCDMQSRICKSNQHCNLYDFAYNEINYKQNTKFEQENLFINYKTNLSQQKSLKAKSHKNINQSNATDIQNLIDSNCERDYTTSIQARRKGSCEINKSITTEKSNKFHLQIKEKEQKNIDHTVHKFKRCNKKSKKNKYSKRMVKKINTNNSPIVTTVQSSKIDTKMNKNIAMHRNCIDNKGLIIPLTRIDDLPSSELSKLIQAPKSVQVKQNRQQENKNVYFETKNITETQCSTYKQYRTINLKQDEEINILYKSVRRYAEFKDNGEEEINANIKLERNTYKMSLENKVNTTEILLQGNGCKLESTNLLENILQLFLKNKRNIINIKTRQKSKIETYMRKSVAICGKCVEVFNLLRQFSGKINFIQNEKLCIECTLCNVQINSLFHFQQHVMDIHLQCERKLTRNKKFPVVIINFSEQVNVDRSSKFIFECCCCSRIFDHMIDFEEHIKNMHCMSDIKKCKSKQIAKSSELYTFKNEQVLDETRALNKHYAFDISTNVDEISSQITEKNSEIIENIGKLNINEKYANGISKIAIISKSELSNILNIKIDRRFKTSQKRKRFSFICNICLKKYKRRNLFLSHISEHVRNSDIDDVREQQKARENNNLITFDNDLVLNSNIKTSQDFINSFKDNNTSNSTVNLEELNQNLSKIIDKKVNSFENTNMEYVTKEDSISKKIDDYSCLIHINLTQKTEKGIERQKSIKFNIDVAKKNKTSTSEQLNIENKIENKRPKSFTINSSKFVMDINEKNVSGLKKLQCNICDKKFSSLTILKQHMFILHDSLFEDSDLSNLPTMPYFNNNHKVQNLSTQDIDTFKEKHDLLYKMQTSEKTLQNGDKQFGKEAAYQTFNTDKKNRKWRCNPCKENFALLRNYLRHKYYCHNDESVVHICDNCNKILTSVAMVNIHTCANVTSWICKRCNLNFSSGVCLTKHNMNCHLEKVGPHICKICKLSFLTVYMLTKHEVTHSK